LFDGDLFPRRNTSHTAQVKKVGSIAGRHHQPVQGMAGVAAP
jgi:hypothetical protein